jgi:ComF family protein
VQASLARAFSILGRETARIVLPSWCAVCERELPWRDRTASCCASCWSALPKITGVKCDSCALPLAGEIAARCIDCQLDPFPVEWCDAWGHYAGGLERLLHAFKFQRHDFLDDALAMLIEETLADRRRLSAPTIEEGRLRLSAQTGQAVAPVLHDVDAIVPVPMSRRKQRRRGYNQAELLGRAVAKRIDVPCRMLLTKASDGQTQSLLPRDRRAANVRHAFTASRDAKDQSLLLIDDICTTGETLRACAKELLRAGAARVSAITVAKAS